MGIDGQTGSGTECVRDPAGKEITGCLIVAAGRSSRMGECKPLLPLGDETILRRGILTMRAAQVSLVVVVTGREAETVAGSVSDLRVEIVRNEDYETTQMLDSVKLGLRSLKGRCRTVLFAPADSPLYSEETVRMLLEAEGRIRIPVWEGRSGHPVCFDAGLIDGIEAYDGPGGLAGALETLGERTFLPCTDEGICMDADTPEDYERMKEYYARCLSGKAR